MNLPNALTVLRLLLVPVVLHAVLRGRHVSALAWFALAAVTDALDGALARRLGRATPAGAILDPIADKLLLSGVYLALAWKGGMPWWLAALVLGRDVLILAAVALLAALGLSRRFPPSAWGKASTASQAAAAVVWMTRNAFPVASLDAAARALVWPAAVLTLVSGIDYAVRGARMARIIDAARVRE